MLNYTDLYLKHSESVSTPEKELNTIWTHFILRLENMIHSKPLERKQDIWLFITEDMLEKLSTLMNRKSTTLKLNNSK